MPWIAKSGSLTTAESNNNGELAVAKLLSLGFAKETTAAMVGCGYAESGINPGRHEVGGLGYGIWQWTASPSGEQLLKNHCAKLGLSPYTDGNIQCTCIKSEILNKRGVAEWYTTQAFINPYKPIGCDNSMVGITGQQFISNSGNHNEEYLARLFIAGYLRPDYTVIQNRIGVYLDGARRYMEYINTGNIPAPDPDPPSGSVLPDFFPNSGLDRILQLVLIDNKFIKKRT